MFRIKGYRHTNYRIKLSGIIILVLAALFIMRDIRFKEYNARNSIIEGDIIHYYAYLPALLVYNDLKLDFVYNDPGRFSNRFWPVRAPNGKFTIMTTMGMSIMYAPFILPTHYFLKFSGQEANGFSRPYKIAILLSVIFYVTIAFLLIRKLLSPYYSDPVITLVIIGLALGTNLVYYTTHAGAYSHGYSFFLITWFLYNTVKYYNRPSGINSILLGISLGLITLVRPTNLTVAVILPLWGVTTFGELKERVRFFLLHWKNILTVIVTFILIWMPQILYWKMTTGQYFFNGYGDGGRFFFNNPQIINILFSYRKGWLLYTPLMILPLIGFIRLFKTHRGIFYPVITYFLINVYVLASWWLWWYGGSYGNRAFIDMYGVLAFPFASLFHYLMEKKPFILKTIPYFLTLLFVSHNLFQHEQYINGAIDYVSMTKEAYWDSFGRLNPSREFQQLLDFPDYEAAKKGEYPKPAEKGILKPKPKTREFYEKQLKESPEMMRMIEEKAMSKGISIDSMVKLDADWLYENAQKPVN